MAKRKDKEILKLKKEIEFLRSELKQSDKKSVSIRETNQTASYSSATPTAIKTNLRNINEPDIDILLDAGYIKSQLLKTTLISVILISIIVSLYIIGFDQLKNNLTKALDLVKRLS